LYQQPHHPYTTLYRSQFKTGEELHNFMKTIQKRRIEKMLEAELDAHLDYDKHSHRKEKNSCNGYSTKTIKTSYGNNQIKVPRNRDRKSTRLNSSHVSI